jgi:hypothetical protein
VGEALGGQHSAATSAFFDYFRTELNLKNQTEKWLGNKEVTENAGWWIPCRDICFVSERHTTVNRDDWGRLHSTHEAAVQYPDGWEIYAIHGVRLPEYIIKSPEKITVSEIEKQSNAEVRRVMIEKYGHDRYLKDSNAVLFHKDKYGELYRKEIENNNEPFCMVKVINSTPEPDGIYNIYFLQVPPHCETAHEAVAWTFDQTKEEYQPSIET